MDSDVMDRAMEEARQVAEQYMERRLKGLQRVINRKQNEITELRARLAAYEQEEEPVNG